MPTLISANAEPDRPAAIPPSANATNSFLMFAPYSIEPVGIKDRQFVKLF
jgi:hypothetical protein